jgi:hypothetical protein
MLIGKQQVLKMIVEIGKSLERNGRLCVVVVGRGHC